MDTEASGKCVFQTDLAWQELLCGRFKAGMHFPLEEQCLPGDHFPKPTTMHFFPTPQYSDCFPKQKVDNAKYK